MDRGDDRVKAQGAAVPTRGKKARPGEFLNMATHGTLIAGQAAEEIEIGDLVYFDQQGMLRRVKPST